MGAPLKVLIYGDTLVLSCLRASLASYAGIELAWLEEPTASERDLTGLCPDVIIFDIDAVHPPALCTLTWQLPDLRLFGIDPSTNRITVWSGQQLSELSMHDLAEMIARKSETAI